MASPVVDGGVEITDIEIGRRRGLWIVQQRLPTWQSSVPRLPDGVETRQLQQRIHLARLLVTWFGGYPMPLGGGLESDNAGRARHDQSAILMPHESTGAQGCSAS